jgi:hypothetical protein
MKLLMDILRVKVKSNVMNRRVLSLSHLSPAGEKSEWPLISVKEMFASAQNVFRVLVT